jgi:CheY-like chemotaxis protein
MRRTILLADDSPTIRRLVTQTFADGNYEIVSVSNGDAAIKTFEEVSPHVVLADIYMPGKNGYEVCVYIRKHPRLSATPVVLLVGAFDAFDEETAKEVGATANITKPFEPGALIELVRSILPAEPEPEPEPEPARADTTIVVAPEIVPLRPAPAAAAAQTETEDADLLGLGTIFREPSVAQAAAASGGITEADIDRIVDRVIQKISTQVI